MSSPLITEPTSTPAALGFQMPAEWEPHEATWIAWPHNRNDWPGKLSPIHWVYADIVRILVPKERVRILIPSSDMKIKIQNILKRVGVDLGRIDFFQIPTNRSWMRDYGPIFVRRFGEKSETAIIRFRFNAWAKYGDWQLDNQVPDKIREQIDFPFYPVQFQNREVVLEGGSIDGNGRGTLITTEECLLDPKVQVRNPGFSQKDYESIFQDYLGVNQVVWLGRGIAGDDTHGHVDDVCRFVNPNTVVLGCEENPQDENYRPLQENREQLQNMKLEDESRIEVIDLPMPHPLYFDGRRLPASYVNFYMANDTILAPTFNDSRDRKALGILAELFPDRQIVGIHAVDLVWGLGTLHCLTQPQPLVP